MAVQGTFVAGEAFEFDEVGDGRLLLGGGQLIAQVFEEFVLLCNEGVDVVTEHLVEAIVGEVGEEPLGEFGQWARLSGPAIFEVVCWPGNVAGVDFGMLGEVLVDGVDGEVFVVFVERIFKGERIGDDASVEEVEVVELLFGISD